MPIVRLLRRFIYAAYLLTILLPHGATADDPQPDPLLSCVGFAGDAAAKNYHVCAALGAAVAIVRRGDDCVLGRACRSTVELTNLASVTFSGEVKFGEFAEIYPDAPFTIKVSTVPSLPCANASAAAQTFECAMMLTLQPHEVRTYTFYSTYDIVSPPQIRFRAFSCVALSGKSFDAKSLMPKAAAAAAQWPPLRLCPLHGFACKRPWRLARRNVGTPGRRSTDLIACRSLFARLSMLLLWLHGYPSRHVGLSAAATDADQDVSGRAEGPGGNPLSEKMSRRFAHL